MTRQATSGELIAGSDASNDGQTFTALSEMSLDSPQTLSGTSRSHDHLIACATILSRWNVRDRTHWLGSLQWWQNDMSGLQTTVFRWPQPRYPRSLVIPRPILQGLNARDANEARCRKTYANHELDRPTSTLDFRRHLCDGALVHHVVSSSDLNSELSIHPTQQETTIREISPRRSFLCK